MKKIKNNFKNFVRKKSENLSGRVWDFLPQTCDICGSWENPADPLVKCGYGWADDEDNFCDNIIVDRENKRVICRCCC